MLLIKNGYVRDVVAGALIGAVSGALGHLVFFLF